MIPLTFFVLIVIMPCLDDHLDVLQQWIHQAVTHYGQFCIIVPHILKGTIELVFCTAVTFSQRYLYGGPQIINRIKNHEFPYHGRTIRPLLVKNALINLDTWHGALYWRNTKSPLGKSTLGFRNYCASQHLYFSEFIILVAGTLPDMEMMNSEKYKCWLAQ